MGAGLEQMSVARMSKQAKKSFSFFANEAFSRSPVDEIQPPELLLGRRD